MAPLIHGSGVVLSFIFNFWYWTMINSKVYVSAALPLKKEPYIFWIRDWMGGPVSVWVLE